MGETRLLVSNSRKDDGDWLESKAGNMCLRAKPLILELFHTAVIPFFTPYSYIDPYRSLSINKPFQFPYPTGSSTTLLGNYRSILTT